MLSLNTSSSTFTQPSTPVLIVGAGPTGIFAGLLLTKMGIPHRLIERQHEVSKLSKSLVIHARTLEIFHMLSHDHSHNLPKIDLINKFMNSGTFLADFHCYLGTKLFSTIPMLRNSESHFTEALLIEQSKTVTILTEEYEKLGGQIERGWELMDTRVIEEGKGEESFGVSNPQKGKTFVETTIRRVKAGVNIRSNESKVLGAIELEADLKDKEYDYEVVRSEYLIASDGGKSTVRHKLNIAFPGRTLGKNIIIYDGQVTANIPVDKILILIGDSGRTAISFPLGDNRIRLMLDCGDIAPGNDKIQEAEELTIPKFQKILDEAISPAKMQILDCKWLTYYRVNERLADRYSDKGRIFLCGDAAHVHSPAGGQGLNMGLQDAFNLTWKMSLVLKGSAPGSILDTYEAEHSEVARNIVKLSAGLFGGVIAEGFWQKLLKRFALLTAPYILPRIPQGPPMCMLRIRYRENNINRRCPTQSAPAEEFQVGVRARDGALSIICTENLRDVNEQQHLRLHDLLIGPGIFHILVFTSDMLAKDIATDLKDIRTTVAYNLSKNIETSLATWGVNWEQTQNNTGDDAKNKYRRNSNTGQSKMFMIHVITAPISQPDFETLSVLTNKSFGAGKLYLDEDAALLHRRYGIPTRGGPGSIVLLRPDSYIAYRVQGVSDSAWMDVDKYLNSILILPSKNVELRL
ncbi:hypothetical protein BX616_006395 [Lobosporangium transversale]|uniref:FAD binding domain-domain-containing protein n=1 Tax=Lobosporangium transversale TaxID=64571 RepID=A0A1Y2GUY5_9FUNG|nr:FAD binding domain-domain-containing protein [Lobosporangium transversale]KAF9915329.1 hypothetical protein BX616_006395 [Lobosporangium transversale]ORZ22845.1 FAD binding domain-domain-containing protein [Lobosporangium transversale]|eukprot:XP_021883399.1 FAD binding domain-domain-containing protein [Lobosporangium transversale]